MAQLDLPDHKDPLELMVQLDLPDHKEYRVYQETMVLMVLTE
jgi:hypothetical protein